MLLSKRIRNLYSAYKILERRLYVYDYGSETWHFYSGHIFGLKVAIQSLIIDHCVEKYHYRVHDHEPLFYMIFGGNS